MNFLYPQFLYGLFALAIPIIIHLFNFRRTKKVYFSNTQFLKKVKEASSSKRKLKHYLILLSRLLFIFFLVIAFAQPIIKSDEEAAAQSDLLVYFDNSYSMSNEVGEGMTALDEGVADVNELLNLFPSSVEYRFLTNDFDPASNISRGKTEISDLTTELEYSSVPRSFEEVRDRIETAKEKPQSVYWISDFQKSTSSSSSVNFDSTINVNLVPIQFNSYENVAVDSVWLETPFLIGDENLKLNVKVRNYGLTEVEDLIVKVFVDNVQSATASLNIAPNLSEEASFDLAFDLKNISKCRVAFEDFPVTFDNEFYFTIYGGQKINVLEIKGKDKVSNIERVYGNESIFNFNSVSISNLDYNLIEENDFVIINQVSDLDASLAIALNKYLSQKGSVLMVPDSEPKIDSYKQLNGLQNISLTYDTVNQQDLATPDFNNPFYDNVFEEEVRNFAMPWGKRVISWGADRTALLSYQNGNPYLSALGNQGQMYVLSSPLSAKYTSFYSHALFVPVMYRLAIMSASTQNQLYYFTDDQSISYTANFEIGDNVLKLRSEENEIIPAQRPIGKNIVMEVPKNLIKTGFYDLTLGDSTLTTFAFNQGFDESDLSQYSLDEINSIFAGDITVFDVANSSDFSSEVESKYIGKSLWKYAIALALLFLLVEILLIRFFP